MSDFAFFIDYLPRFGGERRLLNPMLVEASSEEDACRIAKGIANFAVPEVCQEIAVRIFERGASGRVLLEIQRPTQP
jgi:hypothetical protein